MARETSPAIDDALKALGKVIIVKAKQLQRDLGRLEKHIARLKRGKGSSIADRPSAIRLELSVGENVKFTSACRAGRNGFRSVIRHGVVETIDRGSVWVRSNKRLYEVAARDIRRFPLPLTEKFRVSISK